MGAMWRRQVGYQNVATRWSLEHDPNGSEASLERYKALEHNLQWDMRRLLNSCSGILGDQLTCRAPSTDGHQGMAMVADSAHCGIERSSTTEDWL